MPMNRQVLMSPGVRNRGITIVRLPVLYDPGWRAGVEIAGIEEYRFR